MHPDEQASTVSPWRQVAHTFYFLYLGVSLLSHPVPFAQIISYRYTFIPVHNMLWGMRTKKNGSDAWHNR